MKTIEITSDYSNWFKAYETTAVTSKGIMRIRCIQLDKDTAERWAEKDNKRTPFFSDIFDCVIYNEQVDEIKIYVR